MPIFYVELTLLNETFDVGWDFYLQLLVTLDVLFAKEFRTQT